MSVNLNVMVEVNSRNNQTRALGEPTPRITDADIHKAVKFVKDKDGAMQLCAANDEIEGFIEAIEPHPDINGRTVGTVVKYASGVRYWVTGTGLVEGDYVKAAAQTAAGVANAAAGHPFDRHGLTAVAKLDTEPKRYAWKVIRVKDTNKYLIEAQ